MLSNIDKIKYALSERGFIALLIIDPVNRFFATGFQSSAGAMLVTQNDAWFFTDSRYMEAAINTVKGASVHEVTYESPYAEQIKNILAELGITSVAIEEKTITYSAYRDWKKKLKVKLVPAETLISDLRIKKSALDLEKIKKAQSIAEKSFNETLPRISTDMTEKDLAAELLYRFLKNGADDKAFDTIVLSGAKTSMPHGQPGAVKIGKGFLTIDFGVRLDGWCSDTTRTLCIGKPDEEMIRVYETVLKAQEAGIKKTRAGVTGRAVDARARAVIEKAGYGDYFGHGFGHGVGLEVHEAPNASKSSKEVLQAGAVISAEPGIYLPGRYGVRIEDVLYVTESGCENITYLTKELIVL